MLNPCSLRNMYGYAIVVVRGIKGIAITAQTTNESDSQSVIWLFTLKVHFVLAFFKSTHYLLSLYT